MPNVITEGRHTAEFMVSEANGYRSREEITILSGENLVAGAVIGKITLGSASATADAGNTGDGTMGAITVGADAQVGDYVLTITEAATNGGAFQVVDPAGDVVGIGAVGTAFTGGGLTFTLADGATDFVVGDKFTVTVAAGSGKWKEWDPTATDGSAGTVAVLYAATDASSSDARATAIVRDAEVNGNVLTYLSGATSDDKATAAARLADAGILVR